MNRSLLCTSILFLSSSALAGFDKDSFDFSVDIGTGFRGITLNDPESTTATLLGDQKSTASVTTSATTTSLSHMTPTAVLSGSVFMKLNQGNISHGLKLGAAAHMASSDTHTIYDGQSTTATIALHTSNASVILAGTTPSIDSEPHAATVGISTITAGKRECKVDHSSAYGLNFQYAFGSCEQGLGLGFGFLNTSDKYQYTVEEARSGGTATGVYNSTEAASNDYSDNFQLGATVEDSDDDATDLANTTSPTYSPQTATTVSYSDNITWTGFVAETSTALTDYISAKGAVGYYWRTFDASPGATTNAPMIVSETDATMFTGHVSIGFSKKNTEAED